MVLKAKICSHRTTPSPLTGGTFDLFDGHYDGSSITTNNYVVTILVMAHSQQVKADAKAKKIKEHAKEIIAKNSNIKENFRFRFRLPLV